MRRRVVGATRAAGDRPGAGGEELACSYLRSAGFSILERNFRCRWGEIDVVAQEGATTVFVEVKQRQPGSHGTGEEAVTWAKRRRVVKAAHIFAAARGLANTSLRFDVVAISTGHGSPQIRHYRNAFDADGR